MKFLILFLFSFSSFAASPVPPASGSANIVYIAGKNFSIPQSSIGQTSAGQYVLLSCANYDGTTTFGYCGLATATSKLTGAGAFQVPAGKSLRILAVKITAATTTNFKGQMMYGDTSVVAYGSNSAPTTPVYETGTNAVVTLVGSTTVGGTVEYLKNFVVPAGKYPAVQEIAGPAIFDVIGILE